MKFIIEHLESKLYKWCFLEYKHVAEIVGNKNLIFTNIKNAKDRKKLNPFGKTNEKSVAELNFKNCCVLDPNAEKTLIPKEAKKFSCFIFGGILGDYPAKKRTKKLLTSKIKNVQIKNLGKKQMATDNAVLVVKKIIRGKPLAEIKFCDKLKIKINKVESIILPYRYVCEKNNKPVISKELIEHIKKSKGI